MRVADLTLELFLELARYAFVVDDGSIDDVADIGERLAVRLPESPITVRKIIALTNQNTKAAVSDVSGVADDSDLLTQLGQSETLDLELPADTSLDDDLVLIHQVAGVVLVAIEILCQAVAVGV